MSPLQIVLGIVLIILAVIIIVFVMLQESQQQGLSGAISGGSSDSFFGKNKGRTDEAKKVFITKIAAAIFLVLVLVASIAVIFA